MIVVLPRQARDKHSESTQKREMMRFLAGLSQRRGDHDGSVCPRWFNELLGCHRRRPRQGRGVGDAEQQQQQPQPQPSSSIRLFSRTPRRRRRTRTRTRRRGQQRHGICGPRDGRVSVDGGRPQPQLHARAAQSDGARKLHRLLQRNGR
jgi:hypothetical protein